MSVSDFHCAASSPASFCPNHVSAITADSPPPVAAALRHPPHARLLSSLSFGASCVKWSWIWHLQQGGFCGGCAVFIWYKLARMGFICCAKLCQATALCGQTGSKQNAPNCCFLRHEYNTLFLHPPKRLFLSARFITWVKWHKTVKCDVFHPLFSTSCALWDSDKCWKSKAKVCMTWLFSWRGILDVVTGKLFISSLCKMQFSWACVYAETVLESLLHYAVDLEILDKQVVKISLCH